MSEERDTEKELAPAGSHLIEGEFQSDKYPTCPRGKVPLSVKDTTAQDLLWEYAQRRRVVDAQFSDDLEEALRLAGYVHAPKHVEPKSVEPPSEPLWQLLQRASDFIESGRWHPGGQELRDALAAAAARERSKVR